VSRGSSRMYN